MRSDQDQRKLLSPTRVGAVKHPYRHRGEREEEMSTRGHYLKGKKIKNSKGSCEGCSVLCRDNDPHDRPPLTPAPPHTHPGSGPRVCKQRTSPFRTAVTGRFQPVPPAQTPGPCSGFPRAEPPARAAAPPSRSRDPRSCRGPAVPPDTGWHRGHWRTPGPPRAAATLVPGASARASQ